MNGRVLERVLISLGAVQNKEKTRESHDTHIVAWDLNGTTLSWVENADGHDIVGVGGFTEEPVFLVERPADGRRGGRQVRLYHADPDQYASACQLLFPQLDFIKADGWSARLRAEVVILWDVAKWLPPSQYSFSSVGVRGVLHWGYRWDEVLTGRHRQVLQDENGLLEGFWKGEVPPEVIQDWVLERMGWQ